MLFLPTTSGKSERFVEKWATMTVSPSETTRRNMSIIIKPYIIRTKQMWTPEVEGFVIRDYTLNIPILGQWEGGDSLTNLKYTIYTTKQNK